MDTHICMKPCRESYNTAPCRIEDSENVGNIFNMICNLGYRTKFRPIKPDE